MLNYNVYNHINNEEFLSVENSLIVIEKTMIEKLKPIGWKLTKSVTENDALIIDFILDDEIFMGNIGLTYVDEPGEPIFSFYVTKSYDEFNKRYFVKHFVAEDKSLEYHEQNIDFLIDTAVALYKKWDKNFIYENSIVI